MLFSNRQFYNFLLTEPTTARSLKIRVLRDQQATETITYNEARAILRNIKDRIARRQMYDGDNGVSLHKWYRPWYVVPALKNFSAPAGDFGVGVEIEMGFVSGCAAVQVANHIKNWKHIAIDEEGGNFPLEVTFPPVCYSKVSKKSQMMRYLSYLESVSDQVVNHSNGNYRGAVGTHVNVSIGGVPRIEGMLLTRMGEVNNRLQYLSTTENFRYFGRNPYGYLNSRGTHIEMKLFNSQLDPDRLRQYIDIAVSITKLIMSNEAITRDTLVATLEAGYNKSNNKKTVASNVSTTPSLALAA